MGLYGKWLYKLLYASERPTFFYHGLELVDLQDLLSLHQEKVNQTKIPSSYPNDHGGSLLIGKIPRFHVHPHVAPALFEQKASLVLG